MGCVRVGSHGVCSIPASVRNFSYVTSSCASQISAKSACAAADDTYGSRAFSPTCPWKGCARASAGEREGVGPGVVRLDRRLRTSHSPASIVPEPSVSNLWNAVGASAMWLMRQEGAPRAAASEKQHDRGSARARAASASGKAPASGEQQ
jgi:hypothetical protein